MKEREKRYLLNQLYQPFWDPEHSWRPPAAGREGEGRPAADVRAVLQWRKQPADLLDADPGTGWGVGGEPGGRPWTESREQGSCLRGGGHAVSRTQVLRPQLPIAPAKPQRKRKNTSKEFEQMNFKFIQLHKSEWSQRISGHLPA